MNKLTKLAIALVLPLIFVSMPIKAQAQAPASCEEQINNLIQDTKSLCTCNVRKTTSTRNKLLKKLYDAKRELMKGSVKSQYNAAKKVWEYDWELRKLYFKGDIGCDGGAPLDESALSLLVCTVDLYYPNSGYDPYKNGVISCP